MVESLQPTGTNMPYMKIEDTQYFSKLLEDVDEEGLPAEEQREREIMRLLLKIKNGTPPMRKASSNLLYVLCTCTFFYRLWNCACYLLILFIFTNKCVLAVNQMFQMFLLSFSGAYACAFQMF